MNSRFYFFANWLLPGCLAFLPAAHAQQPTADQIEFFEQRIRPVLVEQCYECHNSSQDSESDLALDYRGGMRDVVEVATDSDESSLPTSQLLRVIRHEIDGLEMPEGGAKLDDRVIADFETWIQMGAPDPRELPPSGEELKQVTAWETIRDKRAKWWSFRPLQSTKIPGLADSVETNVQGIQRPQSNTVDAFIDRGLRDAGLEAAPMADRRKLIRRLSLILIGLPPEPEMVEDFVKDPRPDAYERLVDRLLASPRFGERWARHWMDWIRYAESHGSEGDPRIFGAEHYRDYLIRALNADVPYDQLLMEHIAGDLLEEPRVNSELGINESLIGTAHWRMVFHGFAPTDVLDEKVRFTDDAMNAFSKAFLGLTVSCARCHDHKFDAISQADYYALFGILASTRPGRSVIDLPEKQNVHRKRLEALREKIRDRLSSGWMQALRQASSSKVSDVALEQLLRVAGQAEEKRARRDQAKQNKDSSKPDSQSFQEIWDQVSQQYHAYSRQQKAFLAQDGAKTWNLAQSDDLNAWFRFGNGLSATPTAAGQLIVAIEGDRVVDSILPGGVYSHEISDKHAARLESPAFSLDDPYKLWLQVSGDGQAAMRYVVQDYPRNGTVFPVQRFSGGEWHWQSFDLSYWQGDLAHIELTTAKDAPLLYQDQSRSWFGIRQALVLPSDHPPPPAKDWQHLEPLLEAAETSPPESFDDLKRLLLSVVQKAVGGWQQGTVTAGQALLLDRCLESGILENRLSRLPTVRDSCETYRRLEAEIPSGQRVPTLSEWSGRDYPLYERGDHKRPGDPVARRFLEVIDGTAYQGELSGRLELANDMLRRDNPFTARVIVNRVWHHLFGEGIVGTVDNFGRLGDTPSHPELLDHLADQFRSRDRWSLKMLIRRLVTSRAWQRNSLPPAGANEVDPENKLLSHFHLRRLSAESIRDSLLAASGQLDTSMYGPSVAGNGHRRSIYVRVIRNNLDAFLTTFNAPVPFTTTGRRDVTNVPAQSLALMNSPRVRALSEQLVRDLRASSHSQSPQDRITTLWREVFARPPRPEELSSAKQFIAASEDYYAQVQSRRQTLQADIEEHQREIEQLRDAALRSASTGEKDRRPSQQLVDIAADGISPLSEWKFDSLEDSRGDLDLKLGGSARLAEGALVLDGEGWAESPPLDISLGAKTMEVSVILSDVKQQGGGVMTIQDLDGQVFDAIVFGEQKPAHWLVGSEYFRRTENLGGTREESAMAEPVHLVAVFDPHGQISLYRNGQIYGRPYKTATSSFQRQQSMLLFGLRHGRKVSGNRMLKGRILEAKLYDRPLEAAEVEQLWLAFGKSQDAGNFVDLLTPRERQRLDQLKMALKTARQELGGLVTASSDAPWEDLAHAMFNMKEFIYVR